MKPIFQNLKDMNVFEREKYWKKHFYLMFFVGIFSVVFITSLFFVTTHKYIKVFDSEPDIFDSNVFSRVSFLGNFSYEEKERVYKVVGDLDPDYSALINRITFVKERSVMDEKCKSRSIARGCNVLWDGEIYVYYSEGIRALRITVCHEILHSVLRLGDVTHDIVYDLGINQVCY